MNTYNTKDLVLCAFNNLSAKQASTLAPVTWPPLTRWSDITFLQWAKQMNSDGTSSIKPPKYIIRLNLRNEKTQTILTYIKQKFLNNADKLPEWPGVVYQPGSDQFNALLGSPNGFGAAWLLINHKMQFGVWTIDQITIFNVDLGDRTEDIMLLRTVEVPQEQGQGPGAKIEART
jgi:hypothetical protein